MKIEVNIEKKHLAFLLLTIAMIIWSGFAFASLSATIPNPGHSVSELQTCDTEGEILKIIGGTWNCAADETGVGGGSVAWTDITGIPAGFADNVDNEGSGGAETDPTVTESVKDGVDWSEISNKPSKIKLSSENYFVYSIDEGTFPGDQNNWQTNEEQTWIDYGSVTITTESPGWLLIQANGDLYTFNAGSHGAIVGISETSAGEPPAGAFVESRISIDTSNYRRPWTVSEVIYKSSAGEYTFYIVGSLDCYDTSNNGRLDIKGTAQIIFFPA